MSLLGAPGGSGRKPNVSKAYARQGTFSGGRAVAGVVVGLLLAAVAFVSIHTSRAHTTALLNSEFATKATAWEAERQQFMETTGKLQEQIKALEGDAPKESLETKEVEVVKEVEVPSKEQADEIDQLKNEVAKLNGKLARQTSEISMLTEGKPAGTGGTPNMHDPWGPDEAAAHECKPAFGEFLASIAINNEVLAAISNKNLANDNGMLHLWVENVMRVGVKNAMVLAFDPETKAAADRWGIPSFVLSPEISEGQKGVGLNHAVSAMKFQVIQEFLKCGYAVLLSDVDIVTLRDPFEFLERDADIEGMSDGFDNGTAYGYNDVFDDPEMGWARWAHSMRVFVINSGLFYTRPTPAALELMNHVRDRLDKENGWDQAVFNEAIFFPSRPGFKAPFVTRRILDMFVFMNSKVLFKRVRGDPAFNDHLPTMIHVNYHNNKQARMIAIIQRYVEGHRDALDAFPIGS